MPNNHPDPLLAAAKATLRAEYGGFDGDADLVAEFVVRFARAEKAVRACFHVRNLDNGWKYVIEPTGPAEDLDLLDLRYPADANGALDDLIARVKAEVIG